MTEVNMSELIVTHNKLAQQLGRKTVESFKSIGAAQAAILKLKALAGQGTTMTEETQNDVPFDGATATQAAPTTTTETSPMNSVNRRGPTQGVGAFCKELIQEGKTNAEILAAVAEKFGGTAKTSNSCIAFYRNALKGGAASRPRAGKVDIAALEAKAAKLAETIAAAKAAEEAKAAVANAQATSQEQAPQESQT